MLACVVKWRKALVSLCTVVTKSTVRWTGSVSSYKSTRPVVKLLVASFKGAYVAIVSSWVVYYSNSN